MTDTTGSEQTPTVEAIVRRDGKIVHRQFCDTLEEAADLADTWADVEGATVVTLPISGETDEDEPAVHEMPSDVVIEPPYPED